VTRASASGSLEFVDELPGEPMRQGGMAAAAAAAAAAMRARPGVWVKWPWQSTYPKQLRARLAKLGDGFEIARRKIDGKTVTFVRFATNGSAPAAADAPEPEKCPKCRNSLAGTTLAAHRKKSLACDRGLRHDGL